MTDRFFRDLAAAMTGANSGHRMPVMNRRLRVRLTPVDQRMDDAMFDLAAAVLPPAEFEEFVEHRAAELAHTFEVVGFEASDLDDQLLAHVSARGARTLIERAAELMPLQQKLAV